jgi:acyl-CoA synthetase (AMP-forming)/AMP-acid ligase II
MAGLLGLGRSDRLMIVEPLFDATAQFSVAMAVAGGAAIVLERGFSPATFWNLARGHGATQVCLSGSQLSRLYEMPARRADLGHSIRLVLGMGTPPEIHEAFEHRFGLRVVEAFGSAEAGFVTVNPVERGQRKLGTAGLPVPWCEVAVLDDDMLPVPPGVVGQICSRPRLQAPGGNGWQHTGAFGATDEEGFLTVLGPPTRCSAALLRQASS